MGISRTTPPVAAAIRPAPSPLPRVGIARLNATGVDGTAELRRLCGGLTQIDVIALGLDIALTGKDTYAARVRLTNTGTVPVRVRPERPTVHFGGRAAAVTTIDHPDFLAGGILDPGYYHEGLGRVDASGPVGRVT